ncbi:hypothetical protein BDZ88DRAFT_165028 [Geranomyces variabilis]|nr:hypothetical protein BDZ88DRAFT_165028 [Geranomyces variabilis]KAJ3135160.1 hypothetical protein HDU90_004192 [Geranomyces variabilis]
MDPASTAAGTLWAHTWLNVAHAFLGQHHIGAIDDRIVFLQPPRRIPPHRNSLAARCVTLIWARLLHFELNPIAAVPTRYQAVALEYIQKFGPGLRGIEKFYQRSEDGFQRRRAWLRSKGCGYNLSRFLKLVRRANPAARSLLCGPLFVGALPLDSGEKWKDIAEVYEDLAAGAFILCTFDDRSGRVLSSAEFAALKRRLVRPAVVFNAERPHVSELRADPALILSYASAPAWWPEFCLLKYDTWTAAKKRPMFAPGVFDRWLGILHDYTLHGWYWNHEHWYSEFDEYLEEAFRNEVEQKNVERALREKGPVPVIPAWNDPGGQPDTRTLRKRHYNISWAKRRQRMARFL